MSEDVWHCRHPPETSAGVLVPPQRFDTGADTLLPTESVLIKRSRERILGWLARGRHADAGPDLKEALHICIATILSPSVRVMNQPVKQSFLTSPSVIFG